MPPLRAAMLTPPLLMTPRQRRAMLPPPFHIIARLLFFIRHAWLLAAPFYAIFVCARTRRR
jgi:hypothetical protein